MMNLAIPVENSIVASNALTEINRCDKSLLEHFKDKMIVQTSLNRSLVSFQANKRKPGYRWYKYKEAFSVGLIEYLFQKYGITDGQILDPFAGSGTALFAVSSLGINADGIELLPIGQQIIDAKRVLSLEFTTEDLKTIQQWAKLHTWEQSESRIPLLELRITKGAYSEKTKEAIEKYLGACLKENSRVRTVLRFALLCVLESVSFTRKDGQYLRWDYRSGRRQGKKIFNKGEILSFEQAICTKLEEILGDIAPAHQLSLFSAQNASGEIRLYNGSCLEILPTIPGASYDAIVTSPPYCNRYDYTRTYALELALLGTDEKSIGTLRQEMLSCTVENRAKNLLNLNQCWITALTAADRQELLQCIIRYLDHQKAQKALNNTGIPRMVRGYFYELACVIAECSRVLKPNALMFMVNDNVRYAGASISVDLILSDIAQNLGFFVENILVLPNGKGNSSQQMGEHGRESLRKCVYVWRKLNG